MGCVVTLQHNGTRGLRGCMIMQSPTLPWRAGVVYSVEVTFSRLKRRFLYYATGGEPSPHGLFVAANFRPAGVKPNDTHFTKLAETR